MEKNKTYQLVKHMIKQMGETKIYFVVPAFNDSTVTFEIIWTKDNSMPWAFSLYRTGNWTECSALDILDALEEVECDLVEFHQQVVSKILTQVAYMDIRIKDTRNLLGSEVVDASIQAYEEFGKSLSATIRKVLDKKKKSKLFLVED